MTAPNFRHVADPGIAADLLAFFDQFERASSRFIPIMSLRDHADAARDLVPALAQSPLVACGPCLVDPHDGKAAVLEFRERMARLRAAGLPLTTGWLR